MPKPKIGADGRPAQDTGSGAAGSGAAGISRRQFLYAAGAVGAGMALGMSAAGGALQRPPTILDGRKQLARWSWRDNHDDDWFLAHIPFFESPDEDIDATYYYRWELITKHMVYGSPESGYSFTEFMNRPGWSGRYGAISCPMGHQIDELRWLKDRRITDDYIRYWFETPGAQPRSYSNWYGSAVWNNFLANGDKPFLVGRLPSMEAQYQGWLQEHWDPDHSMFHWSGMHDGMETNICSRQTQDTFAGGDCYRPTLNSYVYGDLTALAETATLAGDAVKAADYRAKADALKRRVLAELWDPGRHFFIDQFVNDEVSRDGGHIRAKTLTYQDGKYAGDPHGRELTGYVPWQFHLPDPNKGYEAAWKGITDPNVFLAPYGLYFTERHDPLFFVAQGSCVWSGNNWAYADSQALTAMANVLNDYPQQVITRDDYFKVLKSYTLCQRKNGIPYDAEMSDPDTGKWVQDVPNSSDHYFHSSYNDLIITGLAGLRPRADDVVEVNPLAPASWPYFALDDIAYHGRRLSILWDRDGTRYHRGKGLSVWADGRRIASSSTLARVTVPLPPRRPSTASDRPINFAVNNDGGYYPRVRTSSTAAGASPADLIDGAFVYSAPRPLNRWVSDGKADAPEWVEIDFGIERPLQAVKLYVLDDGEGQAVRAPASFALEFWDGTRWRPVPGQARLPALPTGHRPNIVTFSEQKISRLRAVLTPRPGAAVGLTEFEAWGHAPLPLPEAVVQNDLARSAKASASFTSQFDRVEETNDGQIVMNGGRNRWTAYDSPNPSDWVQLDFPKSVTVGRMEICLWADGGGVRTPKRFTVQFWDGTSWQDVEETKRDPAQPTLGAANEITIRPVQTDKLRLTFVHDLPGKSGLTEWLVW
jgi:hypothetical protein